MQMYDNELAARAKSLNYLREKRLSYVLYLSAFMEDVVC